MGRGLPGRYHGFRQWAEQGGGGRHGDDGAEPEGSEVDVETRLAALVQTVVSQEAGGQDITAQPSIVLWLTQRQRAGIIWSSTRRLQWCLSRSCQKLSKVVKSCQKLSKVVKSCCRNVGKLCTSHKIQDTKVISFQTHLATCQDQWVTSRHLWCRKVPCRSGQQSPWVSWLKNRNDDEKGQNIFDLQDILTKNEQSSQNGRNNEPQKARYWDHSSIIEDHDGVGLKAGFRESVVYNAHHVINRQKGIEQTQECE